MACYVAFLRPTMFSGVVAICGAEYCRQVPRVEATRNDPYGYFPLEQRRADEAKQKVRFVLVTGAEDFRYGNILDLYKGGFRKDGYEVRLLDVPGMEHTICRGEAAGRRPGVPG